MIKAIRDHIIIRIEPDLQSRAIETIDGDTVHLVTGVERIERERTLWGTVTSVGPRVSDTDNLYVGAEVCTGRSSGRLMKKGLNGADLIMVPESANLLVAWRKPGSGETTPAEYGPGIRGRL